MKTSSFLTLLGCFGAVLVPRTSLVQAGTYNTTNIFQISCAGTGFTVLDEVTVGLIETVLWTQFALFFGAYTEVQPGQSITLNRRGRGLSVSVVTEGEEEYEEDEEEYEDDDDEEEEDENEESSAASAPERNLVKIRTCPNNCYKPSNRMVCAYNGCAVSGNGRTRQRKLRGTDRKLGTFQFDLEGCVQAMNEQLLTLVVGILFNLEAYIEVY